MDTSRRQEFALPPNHVAPRVARRLVAAVCDGLGPAEVDVAQLLTSELVTNAVSHAQQDTVVGGGVVLVVDRKAGVLRIEVTDPDLRPLVQGPPRPGFLQESGWGLQLVDQLASQWGSHSLPAGEGKVVWFEIRWEPGH